MLPLPTDGAAKLWSHCSGEHEIDAATSDGTIGGKGTDGEDSEAKEGVGDEEYAGRLEESSVAHNVADPQEENGGEHGKGDWSKNTFDHAEPFS